ncbi:hypothetical protein [Roseateles sp. LYH14W]|uniref:Sigma-70 family RNA polymerase sigma factor n=1 Tax=Pelomonas parva TaxID=3299032 RepID=A0ABW7F842_9BURK
MPNFTVGHESPAWWRQGLVAFLPKAKTLLRSKFPSVRDFHEDLISEAVVAAANALSKEERQGIPESWFGADSPSPEDISRFEGYCFTVLNRRIADHFRQHYQRWASFDDKDPSEEPSEPSQLSFPELIDHRRMLQGIMVAIDELSPSDRNLIREVALGGHQRPMTDRERQRLKTLRASLSATLIRKFGNDAMSLVRAI